MDGCEAGCSHFTCGSIGHHKDCQHYPDSMQQMIDDRNERIKKLESFIEETYEEYNSTGKLRALFDLTVGNCK